MYLNLSVHCAGADWLLLIQGAKLIRCPLIKIRNEFYITIIVKFKERPENGNRDLNYKYE